LAQAYLLPHQLALIAIMGQAASARESRMYRMKARKKQYESMKDVEEKLGQYDVSKTGTFSRDEVATMAKDLLTKYTPDVGGLSEDDIDMIMRCGGDNVKPELTLAEVPHAIAIMAMIKDNYQFVAQLFDRFDVDKTGELPAEQLKAVLKDVNGGAAPAEADIIYILKQCEPRGSTEPIKRNQLKAALGCWYCLQEKSLADRVKDSFDTADTKGNGVIEKDELTALLKELNPSFADKELDDMVAAIFAKFDTNKSYVLEYEQFVDWVLATD